MPRGKSRKQVVDEQPKEINFSIIFPSRERIILLQKLLESIKRTTVDLEAIEVLIAVDNDDEETKKVLYQWNYSFVKYFEVSRSSNFSRDYYNFLYEKSKGKWIIAINDDAEFMTERWDVKAITVLNKFIDGGQNIVYGWIEDMLGDARSTYIANYSCWPLLGRDGIKAVGHFFPTRINAWGADIWVAKLYDKVQKTVHIPMTIKHICHHNGTRKQDDINKRVSVISGNYSVEPTLNELEALKAELMVTA